MHIPDLTLIVNVHERHWTLPRSLAYLEDFDGPIMLADSSQHAYADIANYPRARYFHMPGVPVYEKLRAVVSTVKTPYLAIVPDDDFTLLSGMAAAVEHLSANPGVVAVMGHLLRFRHHGDDITVDLDHVGANLARHIAATKTAHEETAAARIKRLIDHPLALNYAVTRTDAYLLPQEVIVTDPRLRPLRFWDRLTLFGLAGAGRITFMDNVLLLRSTERTTPENWPEELHYEIHVTGLRERLGEKGGAMTDYLVRHAGLSHAHAEDVVQYFVDRNTRSFTAADFAEGMPATRALVAGAMQRQIADFTRLREILRRPDARRPQTS